MKKWIKVLSAIAVLALSVNLDADKNDEIGKSFGGLLKGLYGN